MRFASIGSANAGNYASAGAQVANSAARVFDVQRKTGPDYAGLSKVAMNTQSNEKVTAMRTAAHVTKEGINQLKNKTKMQHALAVYDNAKDIKAKQRKAGGIAAIGKIGAAAVLSRDNTKGREYPTSNFDEMYKAYKDKKNSINSKYDSDVDALGDAPSSNGVSSSSAGSDSGKVTGGSSDTSPIGTQVDGTTGWGRLSRVIKAGEGTSGDAGYTTMFTGAQFNDTSRHPRQINRSGRLASDAAGAYQFLSTTWDGAKNALNLPDFSPASQEKAGRYLAEKRGINPDALYTTKAELGRALDRIAPEWASMPTLRTGTSYYGQGGISLDRAWSIYNQN